MKAKDLEKLGVPYGPARDAAIRYMQTLARGGVKKRGIAHAISAVVNDPVAHLENAESAEFADLLLNPPEDSVPVFVPRDEPAPYRQWGEDLDKNSVDQMHNACQLPVAVAGALMPDAHLGYGLPIGGVLATENAVVPYAVGVDIACRMKMTVLDLPVSMLKGQEGRLTNALHAETRFGLGAAFDRKRQHGVMDKDWSISPITKRFKDKAWKQLGSSGSGNHFVEFGEFTVTDNQLGLEPGTYLALLSHSGSRGTGASVASHYSKLAMEQRPELPKQLRHLAWLDMDKEDGQEYWAAMNLMGEYAEANHACIHRHVRKYLGAQVLLDIENHHNFAWKEEHLGKDLIVHRKGATPAGQGVLGIIPGSMASPAYVVRGKGCAPSLNSASHGAGRVMSRSKARQSLTWHAAKKLLRDRGVTLISAGLDEVPMVYKDINEVMAAQTDLVESIGTFFPRLVKMAPPGEKPED
jgi:tRNA-splicing ligase RtcB